MKNRNIRLIIGTILLGLLIIAGTFSLYIWDVNDNKDVGNTDFSGTHEDEYATNYLNGDIVTLDIPTRDGYAFAGYFLSSNGSGDAITK